MKTSIGASVFVDATEIRHDVQDGRPVLTFGLWPDVRRLDLHLRDRATIHAVIAHLVALDQEMDPPVIGCDCMADAPAPSGAQVRIGGELVIPTRDGLCEYCQVEPATVTLTNGRYCEACAPGVQMVTGADVEPVSVTL